jgi:bacillolysin
MKSLKNYAVFTLFFLAFSLNAQEKSKFLRDDNQEIKDLTKKVDNNGWLDFKEGNKTKHTDFFTKHKDAFGLGAKDKMDVIRENQEEKTNYKHYRMQQSYGGVPIEGAEFFLHYNAKDELDVANGKLCEDIKISSRPKLTADKALASAMSHYKNVVFSWQDSTHEKRTKKLEEDPNATSKPSPKLVITFPDGEELNSEKAVLAYRIEIRIVAPKHEDWCIYIEAQTGRVLKKRESIYNCQPKTLTFSTLFNGVQTALGSRCGTGFLGWGGNSNFLKANFVSNIAVNDVNFDDVFHDATNWGTVNQQFTSAYFGLERSSSYFKIAHNREGWDNNNFRVKARIDPNGVEIVNNARFRASDCTLLFAANTMSLDVVAHEYTHGMVFFTAGLGKNGLLISSSLDESFSDIFGEMTERLVTGNTNFSIGTQLPLFAINTSGSGLFFRNLVNPNLSEPFAQPSIFGGANWNGLGQPHTNGGVQNKWFSLLATGDFHNGVTVQSIGADNAAKIAWRNLTNFLGENSNYQDARNGAINAARILFGSCSNELLQTWRAWNAVGLPSPPPTPVIDGITNICLDHNFATNPISLSVCGVPGMTFTWSIPSGIGAFQNGNNLEIFEAPSAGNHIIDLFFTLDGVTESVQFIFSVQDCSGGPLLKAPKTQTNFGVINNIKAYANPTNDVIHLDLPIKEIDANYTLKLINTLGQVSLSQKVGFFTNKIDIHMLSNGIYNIILQDETGKIKYSSKIVKQKRE